MKEIPMYGDILKEDKIIGTLELTTEFADQLNDYIKQHVEKGYKLPKFFFEYSFDNSSDKMEIHSASLIPMPSQPKSLWEINGKNN